MSHARGRGVDPKIMSSNVERRGVRVGSTNNLCNENRSNTRKMVLTFEMLRPDVTVHPPDVVCRSSFSQKSTESM